MIFLPFLEKLGFIPYQAEQPLQEMELKKYTRRNILKALSESSSESAQI